MSKLLKQLENWLGGGPGGEKRIRTFRWLLIIGLVGVLLMMLNSYLNIKPLEGNGGGRASPPAESAAVADRPVMLGDKGSGTAFEPYEREVETRLKEILESFVGVDRVDVMVTIESTEEIVVYRDIQEDRSVTRETDGNGGTRHITEVSRNGKIVLHEVSGGQKPIALKTIKPDIRGVIVVAEGAENQTVKGLIQGAIRKGLDVPLERIQVVPRKRN